MLVKIGNLFLGESKIDKYFKISRLLFFIGVILLIIFPYLSENTYITEKLLKNSSTFKKDITSDHIKKWSSKYLNSNSQAELQSDPNLEFSKRIFSQYNKPKSSEIISKAFKAPRGEKYKFIMINLIYDSNGYNTKAYYSNKIFYILMNFLSDYDNIKQLAKDVQINYISSELFYNNPNEAYNMLIDGRYNELISNGQKIDSAINIDLNQLDLQNIKSSKFLLKINGMNGENVDMDFYKMINDNLISNFKGQLVTTNNELFNDKSINVLFQLFNSIKNLVSGIIPYKQEMKYTFSDNYVYLLENIADNFFMINNYINLNHVLISRNINSILITLIPQREYEYEDYKDSEISQSNFNNTDLSFLNSLELSIKVLGKNEIDLFRGQFHYLLFSTNSFIGYNYLVFPIIMILREFYQLVYFVYNNEYKNFNSNYEDGKKKNNSIFASKILAFNFLAIMCVFIMLLHINYIHLWLKTNSYYKTYLMINVVVFFICFACIRFLNLNKNEITYIDNLLRFILILNCWNFIFINIGIGLVLTVTILPMEYLIYYLKEKNKKFGRLFIVALLIYLVFRSKELIESMVFNYVNYTNNVFIIVSITVMFLILRLALMCDEIRNTEAEKIKEKVE